MERLHFFEIDVGGKTFRQLEKIKEEMFELEVELNNKQEEASIMEAMDLIQATLTFLQMQDQEVVERVNGLFVAKMNKRGLQNKIDLRGILTLENKG